MPRRKAKKRASRRRRKPTRRRALIAGLLAATAVAAATWLVWPFWQISEQFGERPLRRPSRLHARATWLRTGGPASAEALAAELERSGYRRRAGGTPAAGEYLRGGGALSVHLRPFPTPYGVRNGGLLEVRFEGSRIGGLRWRGSAVGEAPLEPAVLASYYGPDRGERRPVGLEELPEELVTAVLAAEDDGFFKHPGLSLTGILRAAWVNLRGGEVRQGGSTLTQQLVKNLFLTHERTLGRKLREVALALLIDLRYSKRAILGAYLNEIYWGSSGGVNLMGVGAAAWAYFGKRPAELGLCESALLAGMIRSPGGYSPRGRPESARRRRDWVLRRMAELDWLEEERLRSALEEPLCFDPHPLAVRGAPYFADLAAAEARRRYGVRDLADGGYDLLSTLDGAGQARAEEALRWGLEGLERGWEKGRGRQPLQGALVSIDPRSGGILAYVGGRDYRASQFDRAGSARRQAGSAFKPVVYAAAFENRVFAPSGFVEDEPLTVALAGRTWSPRNSSGEYRGRVTVRTAVEQSLNVATVRVALGVGLPEIVALARRMGVGGALEPVPALALGAFEVTPLELATVYATLAAGGLRPGVHALDGVLERDGKPVAGRLAAAPERALSPQAAYLVTSVLQGVLDRGTGSSARTQGLRDPLAGKTGTTNDRRDSWFAGYSPDRATLVWVGYDDNSATNLSGARAALPIWTRFTWLVRPSGGYPIFDQPPGVATAVIDPESGELASDDCPQVLTEVFLEGGLPAEVCRLHGAWRPWRRAPEADRLERPGRLRRWLRKILGRERDRRDRGERDRRNGRG